MDEVKRKTKDVDELRRLLDRSISPYELVAKTPSPSHLDRGDSREQGRISASPNKGNRNFASEDPPFGKDIEEICKIYDHPKKVRNSPQVFPFKNDVVGSASNVHVAFHVENPPTKLESTPSKGSVTQKSSKSAEERLQPKQQLTDGKKRKGKTEMMVAGKSCASKSSLNEVSQTPEKRHQRARKKDTVADYELKKSEDHDREMEKLTKELRDANNILRDIELDIHYIKEQREISQQALDSIKANYRTLLEEKFTCQKQISYLRKELCSNRIKDKRVVREFEQLKLFYEKLDHKERSMRKQISLLEAELSLVVQKLKIPISRQVKRPVVPRLELSKLMQSKKLPPMKNPPPAPRKITKVIQVYDSKESQPKKLKRSSWPQHSISSPTIQKQTTRSIPNVHEKADFFPLIGNQKPLSLRPDKEDVKLQENVHLSEIQEHVDGPPHVLEKDGYANSVFNLCIKSPMLSQEINGGFLPKL